MTSTSAWTPWTDLEAHLEKWFHKPDTEALRIVLSCYVAHFLYPNNRPTWPMLVSVPGNGKTEIVMGALGGQKGVVVSSDVTPHSFMSGLAASKGGVSLLRELLPIGNELGTSTVHTQGVILFKDFTSMLAKRPDQRGEIVAAMREIWDGEYRPRKGTVCAGWQGKCTVVGLVTPAFERAWAVQRDLGERFVVVKSPRGDGVAMGQRVVAQHNQRAIEEGTRELAGGLLGRNYSGLVAPRLSAEQTDVIVHQAEYAAQLRTAVERDTYPPRPIIGAPQPEAPTRLTSGMMQIAGGHAVLMGREEITDEDVRTAQRVGRDTVPTTRAMVMDMLVERGKLPKPEVVKAVGLPDSTVTWVAEELEALGAVEITYDRGGNVMVYEVSKRFAEHRRVIDRREGVATVLPFTAPALVTDGKTN